MIPSVQNWAVDKIASYLSSELKAKVSIDEIDFDLLNFDELKLKGFYLEDQKGDTLIYAKQLNADIGIFALLGRRLEIDALELDHPSFRHHREKGEAAFNLQFVIDYFAPPPGKGKPRPWFLSTKSLQINNADVLIWDELMGSKLSVKLKKGTVLINGMDLQKQNLDISSLELEKIDVSLTKSRGGDWQSILIANDSLALNHIPVPGNSGWNIRLAKTRLTNSSLVLNNKLIPLNSEKKVDLANLALSGVNVSIDDFSLQDKKYTAKINHFEAREKNGFQIKDFRANAEISPKKIVLNNFKLRTPTSEIGDTLSLRYKSWDDFKDFSNKVRFDARLKNCIIAFEDIIAFNPMLKDNQFISSNKREPIKISGNLKGKINSLGGKNLQIKIGKRTHLNGQFSSRDLTVKDAEFLDLQCDELSTDFNEIRLLLRGFNFPENFTKLGRIKFTGTFFGFLKSNFTAAGELQSEIGAITSDLKMNINKDPTKSAYSGDIAVKGFDLKTWTDNPDFGFINFKTHVNGTGLTASTINAEIDGSVDSFTYKQYIYKDLKLVGVFDKKLFTGYAAAKDKNIDFTFDGKINFNEEIPAFDFVSTINNLNLFALKLSPQNIQLSSEVKLNFKGNTLDNLIGVADFASFSVVKNGNRFELGNVLLNADINANGKRVVFLDSKILGAGISGNFSVDYIGKAVIQYIENNFPQLAEKLNIKRNAFIAKYTFVPDLDSTLVTYLPEVIPEQDVKFFIDLEDPNNLLGLVSDSLKNLEGGRLEGGFNSFTQEVFLEGNLNSLNIGNVQILGSRISADGRGREISLTAGIRELRNNNKPVLPQTDFLADIHGDSLSFGVLVKEINQALSKFSLNGQLTLFDEMVQLSIFPSDLYLYNREWSVEGNNYIRFGNERIEVKGLNLRNADQFIVVSSIGANGLGVQFENIELPWIYNQVKHPKLDINGSITANLGADNIYDLKGLFADLSIQELNINGDNWGQLDVKSRMKSLKDQAKANFSVIGPRSDIFGAGFYIPPFTTELASDKNRFDASIRINKTSTKIAEYLLDLQLEKVVGTFDSKVRVWGQPDNPNIEGQLEFFDAAITMKALKTRYSIPEALVNINNTGFHLKDQKAYDRHGSALNINGAITHQKLRDFRFEINMTAQNFLAMDTDRFDSPNFYGTVYADVPYAYFSGPPHKPLLEIRGSPNNNTQLNIPLYGPESTAKVEYIRFVNRKIKKDSVANQNILVKGLDLKLNIEANPKAEVRLIFDEQAGDIISGRGTGNLNIEYFPSGEFVMYGKYNITQGEYLYTYRNFINKKFIIKDGGSIHWGDGDPYGAILNLKAYYKGLRTAPYDLIADLLKSETADVVNSAKSTPVDVEMNMNINGILQNPNISFDIDVPSSDQGRVSNYIQAKLRAIETDINELNRQVFGLLVLNKFLPPPNVQSGLDNTGLYTGINTLSELISSQLSLYLSDLLSDVVTEVDFINDLDFDFSAIFYESTDQINNQTNSTSSLRVALKPTFLNNRLQLRLGTAIDLATDSGSGPVQNTNQSYISGDFLIEYLITPDGRFKLRAYNRAENEFLERRNSTGLGLSYRREFDNFKELFRAIKNNRQNK